MCGQEPLKYYIVGEVIIVCKLQELLDKYASESLIQEEEEAKTMLGVS